MKTYQSIFKISMISIGSICLCLLLVKTMIPISVGAHINDVPEFLGDTDRSQSVAWGDVDGDGDLDLAVGNLTGPNKLYLNNNGNLQGEGDPIWISDDQYDTSVVKWADIDGDGDLDLVAGNSRSSQDPDERDPNLVYFNQNGQLTTTGTILDSDRAPDFTYDLDIADMDRDGDLDIYAGNASQNNVIYLNNGDGTFTTKNAPGENLWTRTVSWGDLNNDGWLDIAIGSDRVAIPSRIYLNNNGDLASTPIWTSTVPGATNSLAWGDVDSDGWLDLAFADAAESTVKVYSNISGTLPATPIWESDIDAVHTSIAWADFDKDGHLDLASGSYDQGTQIYFNFGQQLETSPSWKDNQIRVSDLSWGDMTGNGVPDLAFAVDDAINGVHLSESLPIPIKSDVTEDVLKEQGTRDLLLADVDNDNDLDLLEANGRTSVNRIFYNDNGELRKVGAALSNDQENLSSHDLAVSDINNDGFLDIAVANTGDPVFVRLNNGNPNPGGSNRFPNIDWQATDVPSQSLTLAWQDLNRDGFLDLAVGYQFSQTRVYFGNETLLETTASWVSDETDDAFTLVWADIDQNGQPDLVTGSRRERTKIYFNNNGQLSQTPGWVSQEPGQIDDSWDLKVADIDGNGFLDLIVSNSGGPNRVYFNQDGSIEAFASWNSNDSNLTSSIEVVDLDGDGDFDLIAGNTFTESNKIYLNINGELNPNPIWVSTEQEFTDALAIGDIDNDGDVDFIAGNGSRTGFGPPRQANRTYFNNRFQATTTGSQPLPQNEPAIFLEQPDTIRSSDPFDNLDILSNRYISVTFNLYDQESDPIHHVELYYSPNGGGSWLPAIASTGTQTANLGTAPYPLRNITNTHTFVWDTFATGFFGQSDQVVLRMVAYSFGAENGTSSGPIQYTGSIAGPIQSAAVTASTQPFRLRGTQIQVLDELGNPISDAIVYRQTNTEAAADPILNPLLEEPLTTNQNGFLQGRGTLNLGDTLIALRPIEETDQFTVYTIGATPLESGLSAPNVSEPGIQTLTISGEQKLTVFNLVISLEWDARQDTSFLNQLQTDLQTASSFLFDVTDGQAALGTIHIYHDKGYWDHADIAIRASNQTWPGAILGGSVLTPTTLIFTPTLSSIDPVTSTYNPGQIHMPPTWNRFGNATGSFGEDWPRTLVHELGHYLFFLPDHYLGLTPDKDNIILTDGCLSLMGEPYEENASELLGDQNWSEACQNTLLHNYFGTSDYGLLSQINSNFSLPSTPLAGPVSLPLNVTKIDIFAPDSPTRSLEDNLFELVDDNLQPQSIPEGFADVYLIQTNNTAILTDDNVISLGAPVGNKIRAYGAAPGDRLCVFDRSQSPNRTGCIEIGQYAGTLPLFETPGWQPIVATSPVINPISPTEVVTTDLDISVSNISSELTPTAQLLPAVGEASDQVTMIFNAENQTWNARLIAPGGAIYGHIRIWQPDANPPTEIIVPFYNEEAIEFLEWGGKGGAWGGKGGAWGGKGGAWGGKGGAWGGKGGAWGAPSISSDGQMSIFPLDELFTQEQLYRLDPIRFPQQLPTWFAPIGQAYQVSATGNRPPTSSLLVRYLASNVPAGYETEENLFVAYQPQGENEWQLLDTTVDTFRNQVSTRVTGTGTYLLVATEGPIWLNEGWNNVSYPVKIKRLVTETFASIAGKFTLIYQPPSQPDGKWGLYATDVEPAFRNRVNTLTETVPGPYWVHATESTPLYYGPSKKGQTRTPSLLPPMTGYGGISATAELTPLVGQPVEAFVNGTSCGSTNVEMIEGNAAYVIQISADGLCGVSGQPITFTVNGQIMAETITWDNTATHFHNLNEVDTVMPTPEPPDSTTFSSYLPFVSND